MDYADGGDLYSKINERKKLNKFMKEEKILDTFVQICIAVKHVHSKKVLHRDLKTQNIFTTKEGQVKVGDFGICILFVTNLIARVLQHTYDCAKTAIGTPYYLSPEICEEKPYNIKSDIWSLGCMLYEMVTLNHAFDADSMRGLVMKILKCNYPPISSVFSKDLGDLIGDLLQRDPYKRPTIDKILSLPFLKVPTYLDLHLAYYH